MSAYILVDVTITNPKTFTEYMGQVPQTVTQYGGRYLVRGGETEILEGTWKPLRTVILEFPSMEQAKQWYDSEEYRHPKALRHQSADSNMILVQGLEGS